MRPSRHPVLKWIGIVLLAIVLAAVLFRVVAGYWADSKLQAQLDAIAARGEPIRWADLARPPIPDEQNAAEFYKKAAAAEFFRTVPDMNRFVRDAEFRKDNLQEARQILADGAEALDLCRHARSLAESDWKADFSLTSYETLVPLLNSWTDCQKLARLLSLGVLASHDSWADNTTVEYSLDMLSLSDSLYGGSMLISQLVAMSVEFQATRAMEEVLPTLRIRTDTPGSGEASGQQVRALTAKLLDERTPRDSLVRAFIGERCQAFDTFDQLIMHGKTYTVGQTTIRRTRLESAASFVLKPLLASNLAELLPLWTECVLAAQAPNYRAARGSISPDDPKETSFVGQWIYFMKELMKPSVMESLTLHFRVIAMRRMAATALAMRMYEIDHGRRPEKLDQLIPDYLPAVPDDPFSEAPRPIGYRPDTDPPVLYSVGKDGKDDNGAFVLNKAGGVGRGQSPDIVFFLNGDRPWGEFKRYEPEGEEQQPTSAPVNPSDQ